MNASRTNLFVAFFAAFSVASAAVADRSAPDKPKSDPEIVILPDDPHASVPAEVTPAEETLDTANAIYISGERTRTGYGDIIMDVVVALEVSGLYTKEEIAEFAEGLIIVCYESLPGSDATDELLPSETW